MDNGMFAREPYGCRRAYLYVGNLRDYLKRHPEEDIHKIIIGIGRGLEYLHCESHCYAIYID